MAITIKTPEQIEKMRIAGKLVAQAHQLLEKHIEAGVTTQYLDELAEDFFKSHGAIPSFKGYNGYPASICVSVNEEVIHGIPGKRKLKEQDIVSVDIGSYIGGFHGDAARTFIVGTADENAEKLVQVTRQSFYEGIKYAKHGNHLHEISEAIGQYVESFGFGVVRDFVGHGIGRKLHEAPQIPNYKPQHGGRGPRLQKGMTLAIEPMVNLGTGEVVILDDEWTVVTKDNQISAHYENTVLITDGEPELLTI